LNGVMGGEKGERSTACWGSNLSSQNKNPLRIKILPQKAPSYFCLLFHCVSWPTPVVPSQIKS